MHRRLDLLFSRLQTAHAARRMHPHAYLPGSWQFTGKWAPRRLPIALSLLCMVLLTGCTQAAIATPAPRTITIGGATAMQPVLHALTDEFHRQHPGVIFDVRGGGSSLGEERAVRGELAMGASTRFPPAADDGDPSTRPSDSLVRTPIGLDGVAIVVHPTNRITGLTAIELRDLYSGHILDWTALGGEPGGVVLVSREDGSGTRQLFEARIMGNEPVSLTAVVMPSSADVAEYVGSHPQAIGYVSMAYAGSNAGPKPIRAVPLDGKLPSSENLLTQQYLLIQPLYLTTQREPTGWLRQFVDFVLGPTGQEIVARFHAPVR